MDTAARPASFDARLTAYLPGLYSLARRYEPRNHLELAHEVVVRLCTNWASFREDGGFRNWASLIMQYIARDRREKRRITTVGIDAAYSKSVEPNQEHATDLRTVLASLHDQDGEVVIRRVMGDGNADVGASLGISANAAQKIDALRRSAARAAYA